MSDLYSVLSFISRNLLFCASHCLSPGRLVAALHCYARREADVCRKPERIDGRSSGERKLTTRRHYLALCE